MKKNRYSKQRISRSFKVSKDRWLYLHIADDWRFFISLSSPFPAIEKETEIQIGKFNIRYTDLPF